MSASHHGENIKLVTYSASKSDSPKKICLLKRLASKYFVDNILSPVLFLVAIVCLWLLYTLMVSSKLCMIDLYFRSE